MPASRLVFALTDLMDEIAVISPPGPVQKATLTLNFDCYKAVYAEIVNQLGGVVREYLSDGVRSFTYDGLQVICGPMGGE